MSRPRAVATAGLAVLALLWGASTAAQPVGSRSWQEILTLERRALSAPGLDERAALCALVYDQLQRWGEERGFERVEDWCAVLGRMSRLARWFDPLTAHLLREELREDPACERVELDGERMLAVLDDLPLGPRRSGGGGWGRDEKVSVRFEHGKVGIEISAVDLTYAEEAPLSTPERLAVLARRPIPGRPETAVELGSRLLESAQIPFEVARRDDLVVFGAFGAPGRAAELAEQLERMRSRLRAAYFDAGPPRPLLVYANTSELRDEDGGAVLSTAVHFRPHAGLEAYFQPLDGAMVLRKNILGLEGRWYLGTVQHELVHALMAADFPAAPRWLHEGMAALHEETSGQLEPRDNYRLYYLEAALEHGILPTVGELLAADADRWPTDAGRLWDAAARYLFFYLWELDRGREVLPRAYRRLREVEPGTDLGAAATDVLLELTGHRQLDSLDAAFRRWVGDRGAGVAGEAWGWLRDDIRRYVGGLAAATSGSHRRRAPPVAAAPVPRAWAQPLGAGRYQFLIWLQLPPSWVGTIREVAYYLDHPTFPQPWLRSWDAASGFRSGYQGYGCLRRVRIFVTRVDGTQAELDPFDMCAALNPPGGG